MKICRTVEQVEAMSHGELQAAGSEQGGRWPPWFTIDQMRAQLLHEARGCPPPFPGAVWDGFSYVRRKDPLDGATSPAQELDLARRRRERGRDNQPLPAGGLFDLVRRDQQELF